MKDLQEKKELTFEKEDAYKALEVINSWIGNMDTKASILLAYLAVIMGFVVSKGFPRILTFPLPSPVTFTFVLKTICASVLYYHLLPLLFNY